MCDYLFLFDDYICIPGELKGSRKQKKKAMTQLRNGKRFAKKLFNYNVEKGLFIVYSPEKYDSLVIRL